MIDMFVMLSYMMFAFLASISFDVSFEQNRFQLFLFSSLDWRCDHPVLTFNRINYRGDRCGLDVINRNGCCKNPLK